MGRPGRGRREGGEEEIGRALGEEREGDGEGGGPEGAVGVDGAAGEEAGAEEPEAEDAFVFDAGGLEDGVGNGRSDQDGEELAAASGAEIGGEGRDGEERAGKAGPLD